MSFWALGAGIVASVGSAAVSSRAAGKASGAQLEAGEYAAELQQDQYDQTRRDLAPYRHGGNQAYNQILSLYGFDPWTPETEDLTSVAAQNDSLIDTLSSGGVNGRNEDRYRNDPIYRRAWDKTADKHFQMFGEDYTPDSDPTWIRNHVNQFMRDDPEYVDPAQKDSNAYAITGSGSIEQRLTNGVEGEYIAANESSDPMDGFWKSPDYNFRLNESLKSNDARLAAMGLVDSGEQRNDTIRLAGDIASGEFNNYVNRLSAIAGLGQTATNQTAAYGNSNTNNQAQIALAGGDARASAYADKADAINGGINNAVGLYGIYKGQQ